MLISSSLLFADTVVISNSGLTFTPDSVTLNEGDTISFSIGASHNVVEVDSTTWANNGSTSNGGFQLSFGGGDIEGGLQAGTYYYVCSPHASQGMKGIIMVEDTSSSPTMASYDTVKNQGFIFVPDTIRIRAMDTLVFDLGPTHNVVEVDSATWASNGNTSNGGFQLPFSGGIIDSLQDGVYYYVCSPHAGQGMKGIILVGDTVLSAKGKFRIEQFSSTYLPSSNELLIQSNTASETYQLQLFNLKGQQIPLQNHCFKCRSSTNNSAPAEQWGLLVVWPK